MKTLADTVTCAPHVTTSSYEGHDKGHELGDAPGSGAG